MKTTPKPSATKKSSGELVGPELLFPSSWLFPLFWWEEVGVGVGVDVLDDIAFGQGGMLDINQGPQALWLRMNRRVNVSVAQRRGDMLYPSASG